MTSSQRLTCALIALLLPIPIVLTQTAAQQRAADRRAREQWFLRGRTVPGQSAANLRQRAFLKKLQAHALPAGLAAAPFNQTDGWKPVGPLPLASDASGVGAQDYGWVAGRATSVVVDPNDPTGYTVYAGGAFGGVWKSTNGLNANPSGVVWLPLTDNQPTLAIGAIAVQPPLPGGSAGSVVLAGTGEADSSTDSYYGLGILRSADSGHSWTLIQSAGAVQFKGLGFSRIAFSKDNPNLVVAATAGASQGAIDGISAAANLGLYVSNDAGLTWAQAILTDPGGTVTAASATTVTYNEGAKIFVAAVRFHGFYSSSDGASWTRLPNQPGGAQLSSVECPATAGTSACPIYRGELAAVPGRNEMYAWYVDASDNDQGIWKSIDSGSIWTQISDFGISACGDPLDGCGTEDGSYNLTLAAVPSGAAVGQTDIYAGAINLYKCTTTAAAPDCSGVGSHTFLNLTHAYGCLPNLGAPAHVHPAQHAMAFMLIANNTQAAMYFANDGGIYRTLDGYSGLTSGDCANSNSFDNLNQTLGSITQFVSFDQDPDNANTILGGAQGNGSPATAESLLDPQWREVNSGEGGFTAINPRLPDEWFTANTGVSIHKCEFGIDCRAQDFADGLVVSGATLGGDVGPFYTPYILDPGNPSQMIVGTCRVWKGGTDGSGFVPLSVNFDSGSATGCAGTEVNQVRTLAALAGGTGPEMIYAGTDSFGPLQSGNASGGHLWATDPVNGTGVWLDRTSTINPQHFPISAVAIDRFDPLTDPTGLTAGQGAYAAVTGFGSHHIWKTVNGGRTWRDFSGLGATQFPDVPANSIVVDSAIQPGSGTYSGKIYVGTDQGVWVSGTNDLDSPSWSEVGPPLTAASGYLPNVPVTALRIFNNGVTRMLRASTYGRGIWEILLTATPDFQLAVPAPTQIAAFGQDATFTGSVSSLNQYGDTVTLKCVSGPPTCAVAPSEVTPGDGTSFTVTANGPLGQYAFSVQAVGNDSGSITHSIPLTLHEKDYDLTLPSPDSVTVLAGTSSAPISFNAVSIGVFSGSVAVSCVSPAVGVTCAFSPSTNVSLSEGATVPLTVVLTTSASTPLGAATVTLDALTPGGPHRTRSITLNVVQPDYALVVSNSPRTAFAGTATSFTGALTPLHGYKGSVTLKCGSGAPPACTVSPSTVTNIATAFTVSVQSGVAQTYNFDIVGHSNDVPPLDRSATATFTAFDFSLIDSAGPQTVRAGQTATFTFALQTQPGGSAFPFAVSFPACTTTAPLSACASPPPLTAGSADSTAVSVTVTTVAPVLASNRRSRLMFAICLPGIAIVFLGRRVRRRSGLAVMLLLIATLIACGGGGLSGGGGGGGGGAGQPGTAPGKYAVNLTANCDGVTRTLQLSLTVD